ncbi:MAG: hypothetical protein FD137_2610, partial [Spirochaetes bacterium]
ALGELREELKEHIGEEELLVLELDLDSHGCGLGHNFPQIVAAKLGAGASCGRVFVNLPIRRVVALENASRFALGNPEDQAWEYHLVDYIVAMQDQGVQFRALGKIEDLEDPPVIPGVDRVHFYGSDFTGPTMSSGSAILPAGVLATMEATSSGWLL